MTEYTVVDDKPYLGQPVGCVLCTYSAKMRRDSTLVVVPIATTILVTTTGEREVCSEHAAKFGVAD